MMVCFKNLAVAATTLLAPVLAAPMLAADGQPPAARKHGSPIPGKYIIALKPGLQARDLDTHLEWVDGVHKRALSAQQFKGVERTYAGAYSFHGYAGHFDDATVAAIRNNPDVAVVEEDRVWEIDLIQPAPAEKTRLDKRHLTTQHHAPWGLGTISHRHKGSNDYIHNEHSGRGAFAYVVDTGIRVTHDEFEGRAETAFTAFPDENTDTFGHGTHVAGTIGGKTYGVAKKAKLLAVKVFQGRTSATSIILAGFNWAVNDIVTKRRTKLAVINMSLGGSYSETFNKAVDAASDGGVLSVIAAGNEAQDASQVSPASAASAITVSAVDKGWTMAYYSNYGPALDVFGPGSNITSAWCTSDSEIKAISGTSMATPHVVGLALNAITYENIRGVTEVTNHLKETATKDKISGDIQGSPNLIGNNNNDRQDEDDD